MKNLVKFDEFNNNAPQRQREVAPVETPVKPATKPGPRTSPFRKDRPAVSPKPKAEVTEVDIAERFISLMNKKGEDIKKYLKKDEK